MPKREPSQSISNQRPLSELEIALEELTRSFLFKDDPNAWRIICELVGLDVEVFTDSHDAFIYAAAVSTKGLPRDERFFRVRHVSGGELMTESEETISTVGFIRRGFVRVDRFIGSAKEFLVLMGPGQFFGELEAMQHPQGKAPRAPFASNNASSRPLRSRLTAWRRRVQMVEIDATHFREVVLRNGGRTLENLLTVVCGKAYESSDMALRAHARKKDRLVAGAIVNLYAVGYLVDGKGSAKGLNHVLLDPRCLVDLLGVNDHTITNHLHLFHKEGLCHCCDPRGKVVILEEKERWRRTGSSLHCLFDLKGLKEYSDFKI